MTSPVPAPENPPARLYDLFSQDLPADSGDAAGGVRPFGVDELEAVWEDWCALSPVLADVLLVLAHTGLRWSEARALLVGDVDAAVESVWVARSAPEPGGGGTLPAEQARRVPLASRIRLAVEREAAGRDADELLFTTSQGDQLSRTAVLSRLRWSQTSRGRRLADLRHTAAALWLADGIDASTVRLWLGERRLAA